MLLANVATGVTVGGSGAVKPVSPPPVAPDETGGLLFDVPAWLGGVWEWLNIQPEMLGLASMALLTFFIPVAIDLFRVAESKGEFAELDSHMFLDEALHARKFIIGLTLRNVAVMFLPIVFWATL